LSKNRFAKALKSLRDNYIQLEEKDKELQGKSYQSSLIIVKVMDAMHDLALI